MKILKNVFGHLKTIHIHRKFVMKFCFQAGLFKQGFLHDLSKYSPTEFIESVKYYSGVRSPIDACKEKNEYSMAWFHHRARNKHHYEFWCDNFDKGTTCVAMPFKYALECVCDYLGAGAAYNHGRLDYESEWQWWLKKRECAKMHEHTKAFISAVLYACKENGNSDILYQRNTLRLIYEKMKKGETYGM